MLVRLAFRASICESCEKGALLGGFRTFPNHKRNSRQGVPILADSFDCPPGAPDWVPEADGRRRRKASREAREARDRKTRCLPPIRSPPRAAVSSLFLLAFAFSHTPSFVFDNAALGTHSTRVPSTTVFDRLFDDSEFGSYF